MVCPVCGNPRLRLWAPERDIRREIHARSAFVRQRIRGSANPAELKDLVEFTHGFAAPLYTCPRCGLAIRGESQVRAAADYERDSNDRDLMLQLLPLYVEAFRRKSAYRDLLPRGARVLEVGSHLGAFLQVAQEWNWMSEALDVGVDTAAFARARGFRVGRAILEEAPLPERAFDAVFIWNCFEQLDDPRSALQAARRLLSPGGLLVVRVPNAWFYAAAREPLALAYNNLLGFPYLYGYTAEILERLMAGCGFEPLVGFNSELITMPFADPTERVAREQKQVSRVVERWTRQTAGRLRTLTGPWIEMVFRRSDGSARRAADIDRRFLRRAA